MRYLLSGVWQMKNKRITYICMLIVLFLSLIVTGVSAKDITVVNASGVLVNSTRSVNVTIGSPGEMSVFEMTFNYDPSVMKIASATSYLPNGWVLTATPQGTGVYFVSGYPTTATVVTTNQTLFSLNSEALKNDGTSSLITPTIETIEDPAWHEAKTEYTVIAGTFTTFDQVPPVVTITSPIGTVAKDFPINATIYDAGGVNTNSVLLNITSATGSTPITPTVTSINFTHATVSASATNISVGAWTLIANATDITGNAGSATQAFTVADSGFTYAPDLSGRYVNTSTPFVNALFVQVSQPVKMFMGPNLASMVDVTNKTDITVAGNDGNITLNYTKFGSGLVDGIYWVNVTGTSALSGQVVYRQESFTVDTQPPVVTITGIQDSDGDGYPEAGELLTISYHVVDSNPTQVWIGSETNNTRPDGKLFFTPDKGNLIGNRNTTIWARDVAGFESQSSTFHIYNNYIAYITDPSLGTVIGLNLTLTSVYDIFNATGKAITITGQNSAMVHPEFGVFNKTMTPGSKVVIDDRGNQGIAAGALPDSIPVYDTPTGMFDFNITLPHVKNTTMILLRMNSTYLNQSSSSSSLKNIIDMNLIAIYSNNGVQLASVGSNGAFTYKWGTGSTTLINNDLPNTIRANYMDPSVGYSTVAKGLSFDVSTNLTKGEYVLAAVCMDNDRFGIIAQMPLYITELPKENIVANATSYPAGVPVKVTSTVTGGKITGMLWKSDLPDTGNMTLDFNTLGLSSLKEVDIYPGGNISGMQKLIKNFYITKGYGTFADASNTNTVEIPTASLFPGTYYVIMLLETGGNVTVFNQVNVTLRGPGEPPVANFTSNVTQGGYNLSVQFYDNSTSLSNLISWNWSFGDGTFSTLQHPVHVYTQVDDNRRWYNVSLNATNAYGSNVTSKTNYMYIMSFSAYYRSISVPPGNISTDVFVGVIEDWRLQRYVPTFTVSPSTDIFVGLIEDWRLQRPLPVI